MTFGPDGCLYIVDWYNKIISHNEVPRSHPERDKTRGRIWRVRHESQPHRAPPCRTSTGVRRSTPHSPPAANTWEVNAAWQEIVDRQAVSLAPALAKLVLDDAQPDDVRIRALWCLEGVNRVELTQLEKLAGAKDRALRKEALRVSRGLQLAPNETLALADEGLKDPDRLVRQEAIRLLAQSLEKTIGQGPDATTIAVRLATAAVQSAAGDWAKAPNFFRDFERYLIRMALERKPQLISSVVADNGAGASVEARAFAAIALGGKAGADSLVALLPQLARGLTTEEILLVASVPDQPAAAAALKAALSDPAVLRLLYDNRSRLTNHAALVPLLTDSVRALVTRDQTAANQELLVRLATGFKLAGLENEIVLAATQPGAKPEAQLAALRALRESGSTRVDVLRQFAGSGNESVRREAVLALAAARSDAAVPALLEVWPLLTGSQRKTAVDRLASSPASAKQLVTAVGSGAISRDELDGYTLGKLSVVLPEDAAVKQLQSDLGDALKPVLRLDGGDGDYVDTDLTLDGPFTVEAWVKLDSGINNTDSILGGSDALDANFYDGRFRVWLGGGIGDIVVARKPMAAEAWTHLAFTRDSEGRFRIYLNGELDSTSDRAEKRKLEHLKVGFSNPNGGTAGEFAEFRVWRIRRTADEIRANANVNFGSPPSSSAQRDALVYHGTGEIWGKLHGSARVERTSDLPPVQTEAEAEALAGKFTQVRLLSTQPGDPAHGQKIFTTLCTVCHTVKGQGGKIGPVLDGAGANGVEALLRNILVPNAAMEAGYRRFRAETRDGEIQEGLLVSQDDGTVVLRQPNTEDLRLPRSNIKRAGFTKVSIMPEGLLEGMKPEDVSDLFAYLKTLK